MERQRRNTKKYSFRQPDLKELRNLTSYVLDPLGFKARFGKLLPLLTIQVDERLMSVLVQFYDPLYRCFTFPDFQLLPTLEEYAYLVGIPILDQVPFSGLESIPTSQEIADMLHIDESLVGAHMTTKGGIQGLPSEFLIAQTTIYGKAMSEEAFEAIFVLLIYGLVLFPNIDKFVDVNAIRIFSTLNLVPTLLGDTYFSLHMRNAKGGGAIIIESCGEFSNVPLLGTCGGINYNPVLARRQLGFPLKDKPNNILLEGVFFQDGFRKMLNGPMENGSGLLLLLRNELNLFYAIIRNCYIQQSSDTENEAFQRAMALAGGEFFGECELLCKIMVVGAVYCYGVSCSNMRPSEPVIAANVPLGDKHNLDFVFKINFRCINQQIAGPSCFSSVQEKNGRSPICLGNGSSSL
ncbi:hypothetical protein KIW84_014008 [Lathyrus oleraceus]|uniref:DUF7745 domain-containing protein n=1 Tax=Pisum sativum TaxID=3888 RepID=A0A9D5BLZ6_PEA|nr:hypothetical protein KIW84_014008 [Pisum sativum]